LYRSGKKEEEKEEYRYQEERERGGCGGNRSTKRSKWRLRNELIKERRREIGSNK
jgi:hypothetical protein